MFGGEHLQNYIHSLVDDDGYRYIEPPLLMIRIRTLSNIRPHPFTNLSIITIYLQKRKPHQRF